MAFYNEEDEEGEEGQGPQTLSAGSGTLGSSGGIGGAEPGGSSSAPKPEPFVGISQYINANKPQSEKLAGQVVGKIDEKAGAVDSALNDTQNSFNAAADSQKVQGNDALLNEVKTNAQGVANDQAKKSQFAQLRDASYNGPSSFEDLNGGQAWAGLQSKLKSAQDARKASGTEEGRMGLIKEVSNNPRQSQGALVFDNLLLQSNPNSAGMLQNAGKSLEGVDDRINAGKTAASTKAQEVAAANAAVREGARGAVKETYSGLRNDLTGREAKADQAQKDRVAQLKSAIASGNLSAEDAQALGIGRDYGTFGLNVGDFVDYVDQADIHGVANQDDMARQQALQALAGDVDLGGDILSSGRALGEIGQGFNFRKNDLEAAKTAKQGDYQSQLQALKDQYAEQRKQFDIFSRLGSSAYTDTAVKNMTAIQAQMDQLAKNFSATQKIQKGNETAGNDSLFQSRPKMIGV